MKKLGIVTGSMSRGGAERVSLALAQYISSKGIEVVLLTSTVASVEYDVPSSLQRIVLDKAVKSSNKVMRLPQLINAMRKTIKENKIDTILIMGVPLCLFAIPGCKGTGAKVVVSERNDPTHFEGKKIVQKLSRWFMKRADGYVFQTRDAQSFYRGMFNTDGVVIPNPLLVENLPATFDGERKKTIVSAGRFIPQKNHMLLLHVFAAIAERYPDYRVVLYGEGSLRKDYESYIESSGLKERVELPGNMPDLPSHMREDGIFVLPSNFEGMPNALIEAMAMGLPCISTDCPCGGPKDLIRQNENGILVPVEDEQALKKALVDLIDNSDKAARIGQNAGSIRDELGLQQIGERWIAYLEKLK